MDIQAYKEYWNNAGETLHTYSQAQVGKSIADNKTYVFLTTWGFPSKAAPFLNFSEVLKGRLLNPNQVFGIDLDALENYLMYGSNGSGDPVCIDTVKQNEIVYLNHDNYFERVFINKSIRQFGLCLAIYRDFILPFVDTPSEDFSNRKFSDKEYTQLKERFFEIDNNSLAENSFWEAELGGLLWERDNE